VTDIDEQADEVRGRGRHDSGGASIVQRDRRPREMAWNIIGSLIVLALAFVANNLYQINLTLAADAVSKQEMARQIADVKAQADRNASFDERQEDHINAMDRRLTSVEQATGVQLRGAPRNVH
jgi:hypothetical protein